MWSQVLLYGLRSSCSWRLGRRDCGRSGWKHVKGDGELVLGMGGEVVTGHDAEFCFQWAVREVVPWARLGSSSTPTHWLSRSVTTPPSSNTFTQLIVTMNYFSPRKLKLTLFLVCHLSQTPQSCTYRTTQKLYKRLTQIRRA